MLRAFLFTTTLFLAQTISAQDSTRLKIDSNKISNLQAVTVEAQKQFITQAAGKVVIKPDASITNSGSTVLDVLEKAPGVMVDRNGGISLRGKASVQVMIDGKPAYLSGPQLLDLLNSMSTAQTESIELITNPGAAFDASGNAGIINIKTKKNRQRGFNGNLNITGGVGRHYKNFNNLSMNLRRGIFNGYLVYGLNMNKFYTDIVADREYYDAFGNVTARLEQINPMISVNRNNNLKLGAEFYVSQKTTIGGFVSGNIFSRKGTAYANSFWKTPAGFIDSSILTTSNTHAGQKNLTLNANLRHTFKKGKEFSVDADYLTFETRNDQAFQNQGVAPNYYEELSLGSIPGTLQILSVKSDFTVQPVADLKLDFGVKSSTTKTDNLADYSITLAGVKYPDFDKSNHFLYDESIAAAYASGEKKWKDISVVGGLRYEATSYKGHQLGNALRGDSLFRRNYGGLFPSLSVQYQLDTFHSLNFSAGRRLDRPAFQKLNPFTFIHNKYTYQRGNPYFLPQYTWNTEISHQFKSLLTTTLSYSLTKNYFSQIFVNEGGDILTYTEGNVGRAHQFGASMAINAKPTKWWTVNAQVIYNYKELKGYFGGDYQSRISQFNFSGLQQFKFLKTFTAELSGYYTTRARNDLQELLYPTGQLSIGIGKQILKQSGTIKASFRDVFHTQAMEGLTDFDGAQEYFILRRDTRQILVSFSYRFGKAMKAAKRTSGSANDELQRANSN